MSPFTQLAYWKSFFHGDGYSHDQIPDLTGKVAIVTGANSGLGYATTVALAAHGARVFLACRSKQRAQEASDRVKEEIRTKHPKAPAPQLDFLELDLGDMNKTQQAAQEFLKQGLPLNILVNNSGILERSLEVSADGIESEFAVNHMGIKESQPSRIVIMSSLFHEKAAGINYDTIFKTGDTPQPHHQSVYDRYARSKLANVLFAKALARRVINEPHMYVNACHPGYVSTRATQPIRRQEATTFSRLLDGLEEWCHSLVAWPVQRGVLTQLYLATSPEIESHEIRGRYFGPIANEIEPSTYARDEKLQDELWTHSEKLANEKLQKSQLGYSYHANSGLGYATTVALAAHGARVFLACRSKQRAQEAIETAKAEIKSKFPHAPAPHFDFLELDQGDMTKTKQSAQEFLKLGLPLYILVNNAGMYGKSLGLTADEIENEFGSNHMGNSTFVFTLELLDRIKESQPSRIVILSSFFHKMAAGINYDAIYKACETENPYHHSHYSRYARSKLANVMFAIALRIG